MTHATPQAESVPVPGTDPVLTLQVINQKIALSVKEASLITNCTERELREALRSGQLQGRRGAGNKWIIPRVHLNAFLGCGSSDDSCNPVR